VELSGGPRLIDLDPDLAGYFGVDGGVLVLEPPAGGPLKSGDVVMSIAGETPANAADARAKIARSIAKDEGAMEWVVRRRGATQALSLDAAALDFEVGPHVKRVIRMIHDGEASDVHVEGDG
ncbi:MAG: hypothetical protein HC809_10220, partial [Gammaproteobacteria bacterium]|nr:hypothetical protein [Gammaproteobacteria bacterium]